MNERPDPIFPDGIMFTLPHEKAPDFVKGKVSINSKKLFAFAKQHTNERGWMNFNLKKSKKGTYYFDLDTYEKNGGNAQPADDFRKQQEQAVNEFNNDEREISPDEIPF